MRAAPLRGLRCLMIVSVLRSNSMAGSVMRNRAIAGGSVAEVMRPRHKEFGGRPQKEAEKSAPARGQLINRLSGSA